MKPNFTITCGADSYTLDLDVITAYSEYFRCATRFGKEASEGTITLHDDEPAMVSLMIEFFHEGDYDATSWKIDARTKDLTWIRDYGSNPYASCESIDQHDPYSIDDGSSLPHGEASLAFGAISSSTSRKRKLQTPPNLQPDQIIQKRQRILHVMSKGSGRALYHTPTPRHMLLHLQLWEVADKYLVPDLQALCTKRFQEAAEYYYPNPEMIDAILWVYEDLPEHASDLREAVFMVVDEHPELLDDDAVRESPSCQGLRRFMSSREFGRSQQVMTPQRVVWPYVS